MPNHRRGFSLIELMIVTTIVAILTGIAIPAYQNHMRKARRADGRAALIALQLQQEKFRASCPSYATTIGAPVAATLCGDGVVSGNATSSSGYYRLGIANAGATGYTLSATPTALNGQNNDAACSPLRITNTAGTIGYTPTGSGCW